MGAASRGTNTARTLSERGDAPGSVAGAAAAFDRGIGTLWDEEADAADGLTPRELASAAGARERPRREAPPPENGTKEGVGGGASASAAAEAPSWGLTPEALLAGDPVTVDCDTHKC